MSAETCPVETWDMWSRRTCGRPVKRDGMCGLHAAARERKARNDEARAAARREAEDAAERDRVRLSKHGVGYQHRFTAAEVADILDARAAS